MSFLELQIAERTMGVWDAQMEEAQLGSAWGGGCASSILLCLFGPILTTWKKEQSC